MAHMVIFRTTDGKPAYHQTEALDDAVRFVEHLRNEEQVTDARIFTMTEVALEFKVHWRVEVATPIAPAAPVMVEPVYPAISDEPAPMAEAASDRSSSSSDVASELSSDNDEAPVPVAVGGGESVEDSSDSDLPIPPPVPSASSRFGLFSRG